MLNALVISNQPTAEGVKSFNKEYERLVEDFSASSNSVKKESKIDEEKEFEQVFGKFKGKTIEAKFGKPVRDRSAESTPPMDPKSFYEKVVKKSESEAKNKPKKRHEEPENLKKFIETMKNKKNK